MANGPTNKDEERKRRLAALGIVPKTPAPRPMAAGHEPKVEPPAPAAETPAVAAPATPIAVAPPPVAVAPAPVEEPAAPAAPAIPTPRLSLVPLVAEVAPSIDDDIQPAAPAAPPAPPAPVDPVEALMGDSWGGAPDSAESPGPAPESGLEKLASEIAAAWPDATELAAPAAPGPTAADKPVPLLGDLVITTCDGREIRVPGEEIPPPPPVALAPIAPTPIAAPPAPEPALEAPPIAPPEHIFASRTDGKYAITMSEMRPDGSVRRELTFRQDIIKIGTLPSSHLHIDDPAASRMHAVMECENDGTLTIIDLGSSRGTFVNGRKVDKIRIKEGDELTIGDVKLRLKEIKQVDSSVSVAPPVMPPPDPTWAFPPAPPIILPPAQPRSTTPPAIAPPPTGRVTERGAGPDFEPPAPRMRGPPPPPPPRSTINQPPGMARDSASTSGAFVAPPVAPAPPRTTPAPPWSPGALVVVPQTPAPAGPAEEEEIVIPPKEAGIATSVLPAVRDAVQRVKDERKRGVLKTTITTMIALAATLAMAYGLRGGCERRQAPAPRVVAEETETPPAAQPASQPKPAEPSVPKVDPEAARRADLERIRADLARLQKAPAKRPPRQPAVRPPKPAEPSAPKKAPEAKPEKADDTKPAKKDSNWRDRYEEK